MEEHLSEKNVPFTSCDTPRLSRKGNTFLSILSNNGPLLEKEGCETSTNCLALRHNFPAHVFLFCWNTGVQTSVSNKVIYMHMYIFVCIQIYWEFSLYILTVLFWAYVCAAWFGGFHYIAYYLYWMNLREPLIACWFQLVFSVTHVGCWRNFAYVISHLDLTYSF